MNNWNRHELSEIAEIRISNVDKKSVAGEQGVSLCNYMDVYANDYIRSDIPFMEATASLAEIEKFKVVKGDVIITKDSETPYDIGIPAVVVDDIENLVCGYHLALIKPKTSMVDPVFLSKQLASSESASYFSKLAAGSTRYGLSNGAIAKTPILLPDIKIQRKISVFLTTLDQTIEKTGALIEKYRQIKAGLMHDLFTRGVTADGKLRPPREQAPELYQETEIGWIPKNWQVKRIKSIFHIQLGKMLSQASKTGKNSAVYLGNKNVQWDDVDLEVLESMDFSLQEREKFKLITGDLLVCEGGEVGRTAIWKEELKDCYYQKAIHRLRPISNDVYPEFMLRFMRFAKTTGMFANYTSQTSIAHLTREKLGEIRMFVPCIEEQSRMIDRFDSLDSRLKLETENLRKLMKQKAGIMHDLLTGKVPIKFEEPEAAHV